VLVDRLQSLPERIAARLGATMESLGDQLRDLVQDKMQSSRLQTRSGRLAQAIDVEADDASVVAGIDSAAAPYAAIQEQGGTTRAHIIETLNARALRFELGGKPFFARRVQHPRSVIPAHSFLGAALADLQPIATSAIADAVAEEAQA
jgi:phage gpG-like protein